MSYSRHLNSYGDVKNVYICYRFGVMASALITTAMRWSYADVACFVSSIHYTPSLVGYGTPYRYVTLSVVVCHHAVTTLSAWRSLVITAIGTVNVNVTQFVTRLLAVAAVRIVVMTRYGDTCADY